MKLREPLTEAQERKRYNDRMTDLRAERQSWDPHYNELAEFVLPRSTRIGADVETKNKGRKINDKIINNTGTRALAVLVSGLSSALTSPSRPWFRLSTGIPQLAELQAVKTWLHEVEEAMREAMAKSNLYNVIPQLYRALGLYGTAVAIIDEDDEDTLRGYALPIGSYFLGSNARQQVDTLYRELQMTTAQLVEKFGFERCSRTVQTQHKENKLDAWHKIIHVIEPNRNRNPERLDYEGKQWKSCWYEAKADEGTGFLRKSGYDEKPFVAVRWELEEGTVYGRSPGMDALGDIKALQLYEKRKAQIIAKITNPPMKGPAALEMGRASIVEGDMTYLDGSMPGVTYEPAYVVDVNSVAVVAEELRQHETRINAQFLVDMWLMLAQSDRRQITATEIEERRQEKMQQLGPALERLMDELLDPLIDIVFGILWNQQLLPPPPPELQNFDLKVEYLSPMAQAQKTVGIVAVERLVSFVGGVAQAKPDVLDKLNTDEMVDEYAAMLGVKPDLVNADDVVAQLREARERAVQAQTQVEQAQLAAQSAKTLSETDTSSDNGLTQLLGSIGVPAGRAAA